jgi:acyl carrier protein
MFNAEEILGEIQRHQKQVRPELETEYVAPRTPTEKKMAEIWGGHLGLEQVGIYDNFFELGGHSLLATQMVARVREIFGLEVPVAVIFDTEPTVASMAAALEQYQIEQSDEAAIMEALETLSGLTDEEVDALLTMESNSD